MRLVWTGLARADRRAIRDHIARDNPHAAVALDGLFAEKASHLASHPAMGRPGRVKGTRELLVHRSHVLIYDVTAEHVRVLRVLHTARKWPP